VPSDKDEPITHEEAVGVVKRSKLAKAGVKVIQPTGSVLCPDCGATCFTYPDKEAECHRCQYEKTAGEWRRVDPVTLKPLDDDT